MQKCHLIHSMKAVKLLLKNCTLMQILETHFAQRTSFFHKQMNFPPSPAFFPVFWTAL
jgi:hypothetical protein